MRLFLLSLIFIGIGKIGFAQEKLFLKPYNPQKQETSIIKSLQEINRQTGIILEYSSDSFEGSEKVFLDGTETTVGDALQKTLKGQPVKLVVKNNKIIIIPSATLFTSIHFPLQKYKFYGYIKESSSREPLISATLYEPSTQRGVFSNNRGYFNFWLPAGKHTVRISYAGLEPKILELNIQNNLRKDILLERREKSLTTVVIKPKYFTEDGSTKLLDDQYPAGNMLNEDDPLSYLYLYPGLQNASYSFNSFLVRGGGADENLFLLDGNRIYNPTHLLGAISIINPTVLKSLRFYKSDFPARLGGSISSVLEIYTKQGNMRSWHGEVNAGLRTGSLTLEGPLIKDKISVMLSARKNIPIPFYHTLQDGMAADFYDAHFKLSAIINPKSKLTFNFYKGGDEVSQTGKYIDNFHDWGNVVGSIRWNYLLGASSFINTSANFSKYQNLNAFRYSLFENDFDADDEMDPDDDEDDEEDDEDDMSIETKYIGTYSSLTNYNVKSAAEIYTSSGLKFNTGIKLSQIVIKPFDNKITSKLEEDEEDFVSFDPLHYETLSWYGEAEIKLGNLYLKPGIHTTAYQFKDYSTLKFQPRLYLSYQLSTSHKLYASYSKMNQFLHLVPNPYAGANGDIWVPGTEDLLPEESEIYNIGYAFQHRSNWKLSVEGYFKSLMNVTNYANGKSIFIDDDDWRENIELGEGVTYGSEIMVHKYGDLFSWQAGYALAWSWRKFKSINHGKRIPYKYDHRHTINAGISYSLSSHMDISGHWSFATGNVYSSGGLVYVDSIQQVPGEDPLEDYQFIYNYSMKNQYRAKSYQRYDISLTYHSLEGQNPSSTFKAGVYNINGADDQYSHSLRGALNSKSIQIKTGTSVFHLIPYLSYTLKF